MRGILEHLDPTQAPITLTDMEAGLEHLKRGTLQHAETLLIVVEPYFKSLEAAGRIAELGRNLGVPAVYVIGNKAQSERDESAIRAYCAARDLPLLAIVPHDADVAEAERQGRAVLDIAPSSEAVAVLADLASQLLVRDGRSDDARVAGGAVPG